MSSYQFKISGFADEAGVTAEEQMNALEKNGIRMLELRGVDGKGVLDHDEASLKTLAEKLKSRGFSVSAIGSPIGKTPIEDDFSAVLENFRKTLKAAEIFKAPYIRAFSFYMPKDKDPMLYAGEVIRRLKELVKRAEDQGVEYALENESGIFTNVPERCVYVLDRIPCLRLIFDPGNFIMEGADVLKAWELLKNRIAYFHIKDGITSPERRNCPAGEGIGHIPEILKDAYAAGFDSILSIEPHLFYL
ncbi:MAG: sugar phosphate isomerase/epimerase, partial [Treponema sp.]|nr:sugar phosphate isomerase/epimerase [Treponema sp.]